jgi:hypothetical protein
MNVVPPDAIDGADVMLYARLGSSQRSTGATRHSVANFAAVVAGLAIAQYANSSEVYLFYCDRQWEVVTDTCHATVQAAIAQAEFEFTNISFRQR